MPPDDPTRRCPDITVARELLGWEPKIPLREGLRRTIEQMRTLTEAEA
jgi:nucleoside-diphosphate-sugar epimerase